METMDVFIGQVSFFAFGWAPQGWVPCDGALYSSAQGTQKSPNPYYGLFMLIQYQFGGSAGQGKFAVPDLRGRCIIGYSNTIPMGAQIGTDLLALTATQMPPHTHTLNSITIPCSDKTANQNVPTETTIVGKAPANIYSSFASLNMYAPLQNVTVSPQGGSAPINLMNPYVAFMPCISYDGLYPTFGASKQ